jgi:DNA-binding CsgD family transcriptional regulator/pimeloyl-ACP methyl ester carboxylesterase
MRAHIEYLTVASGRRLAYTVDGVGEAVLFLASAPFSFLMEQDGTTSALQREIASSFRLIRYDACCSGYSDRSRDSFQLSSFVEEAQSLIDHLRLSRFAVVAVCDAGPVAVALAASNPRVSRLVLYDAWSQYEDYRELAWEAAEAALREGDWKVYTETVSQISFRFAGGERAHSHARTMRRSSSRETLIDAYAGMAEWDVSTMLGRVSCPTLIVQDEMPWLHTTVAERLAAGIPGARLALLRATVGLPIEVVMPFLNEGAASVQPPALHDLSGREIEVLQLLASGFSNREIASDLAISTNTVMRHVSNIYAKTSVRNRVEAAAYAGSHGLLKSPAGSASPAGSI